MNAREMFENLGYRCIKSDRLIWYINDSDVENYRSIEFWFCDCTFEATGNYGDHLMVNVKELEAINKQCKELGWLEEEKPEIKQETNYEHFKDEIIENSGFCFALADGKPCQCSDISCSECGFSTGYGCSEKIKEWLNKPYEKPTYKITQFEYDLLSVHKDYKTYNNIANQIHLFKMREKGYFKGIDDNELIGEILAKCEAV